jgi:hypothetical protein
MAPPAALARLALLAASVAVAGLPPPLFAQEEVVSRLRGEVRVGDQLHGGSTVVLHRVSPESSGEIDSVRVASDGSFEIRLPHVPSHAVDSEIFFASVRYRGLYYFGPAITTAVQLDTLYLIQAYDTLSVPPGGAALPLLSRSLFLEKDAKGWIVTDVFQLSQDEDRTYFSPVDGVTWSYPLPAAARDFEVGQGDLAPESIRFLDGEVVLSAPIPPGDRFLMVRYHLPKDEFLLPLPGRTDRLEILVREPGPAAEFSPLVPTSPVEMEPGNVYRRYFAENLLDTEVQAQVAPEPTTFRAEWLGLFLAAVLGAAGVFGYRRRGISADVAEAAPRRTREEVVLAIAHLDEAFEEGGGSSPEERASYESTRSELLAELRLRT